MLAALALAAAAFTHPPLTVSVKAAPAVSRSLVTLTLGEAQRIFRAAGFDLVWEIEDAAARVASVPIPLRVAINDAPGIERDGALALGWVYFASEVPLSTIHLSLGNAMTLLNESYGTSAVSRMTLFERYTLLGRALGRALAHELGHYLLASKSHTKTGLMRPRPTASEFFSPTADSFVIDSRERTAIASRLMSAAAVAQRWVPAPPLNGRPQTLSPKP